MSVEQLALLGIAVFAFMAVVNMLQSARSFKRTMRYKPIRVRRLVGGTESARAIAESLIKEIILKFPDEAAASKRAKKLTAVLEDEIEKAAVYYFGRVEAIHKPLFNDSLNRIVFGKKNL
jgi:predicted RecB family endonuclease